MTVKNMVGTLARTGVSTAVSVVRHPIGTASMAAGLVKGAAEAGVYLVRSTVGGEERPTAEDVADRAEVSVPEEPASDAATTEDDPRDNIPGPDLATFAPPLPEDLPEPIVIEAEPPVDEAFHTEPKAASRDSAHGGPAGDREEINGYVDEIVLDDFDIETPVGTTGAEVGFNPDTAESDLQQPGTAPLGGTSRS